MKIGVLALQGAFREHVKTLQVLGVDAVEVRKPEQLDDLAGLILPGGESTTIGKLMTEWGLLTKIQERYQQGMAIYGTCAGLILLSKTIVGSNQPSLALMDTVVKRNAFGRQVASFEADLYVKEFGPEPVKAVFIRAPYIESAGPNVQVLAEVNGKIVIARQDRLLATAFHPELTGDNRIHQYFIHMIEAN